MRRTKEKKTIPIETKETRDVEKEKDQEVSASYVFLSSLFGYTHRMLGLSEVGVVQVVLAQALTYVIPGWVFGLAMAQVLLTVIFHFMVRRVEKRGEKLLLSVCLFQSKYTLVPIYAWLSTSALLFSVGTKEREDKRAEE